jgi:hypothetical protein
MGKGKNIYWLASFTAVTSNIWLLSGCNGNSFTGSTKMAGQMFTLVVVAFTGRDHEIGNCGTPGRYYAAIEGIELWEDGKCQSDHFRNSTSISAFKKFYKHYCDENTQKHTRQHVAKSLRR